MGMEELFSSKLFRYYYREYKIFRMWDVAYLTMYKQVERLGTQLQAVGVFEGLGSVIYLLLHLAQSGMILPCSLGSHVG